MSKHKKLSPVDVAKLSDAELRLMIARDNLVKYGSTIAPDTVKSELVSVEPTPPTPPPRVRTRPTRAEKTKAPPTDWTKVVKVCPHCKEEKRAEPDFGVRPVRGIMRVQSWCNECRANTNYYNKPRTYREKGE